MQSKHFVFLTIPTLIFICLFVWYSSSIDSNQPAEPVIDFSICVDTVDNVAKLGRFIDYHHSVGISHVYVRRKAISLQMTKKQKKFERISLEYVKNCTDSQIAAGWIVEMELTEKLVFQKKSSLTDYLRTVPDDVGRLLFDIKNYVGENLGIKLVSRTNFNETTMKIIPFSRLTGFVQINRKS